MKLIYLSLFVLVVGCSSTPKFNAYDGEQNNGYWEEKIATNAFKVYAKLPKLTSVRDRESYLLLRVSQLCKNNNADFYHFSSLKEETVENNTAKISILGFCSNKGFRATLGFMIDKGLKTTVESVQNSVTSKVIPGDKIIQIGKSRVSNIDQIKVAIHKISLKKKSVPVLIDRSGKKLWIKQPVEKTDALLGPKDSEDLKEIFN